MPSLRRGARCAGRLSSVEMPGRRTRKAKFYNFLTRSSQKPRISGIVARLPWRNRSARSAVNRKVGGSSPPGSDGFCGLVKANLFTPL
ncbi:unnamed protein product [Cercopithifilaria johnstoni]|uniref:Uncharacterized protein n=1 Tax=Cercopithifilaria johnstoni TaxID=2874296 RepID=A0A8J2M067_9BILA|nr:unnamed protein product [Cercopithifilaria johnstoni]